ncbi:GNAT family N-acetyltransferase [Mycoplasmopsis edwardii]|uniref:GNAT family N-acetyltransferase n=1 Tax=Mycoplasmopsis edwardii TaxID=53558 RepID=A0ACD4PIG5_9BACT|nr:GNAT family N-acetyltransferase [Mycoplasmopsis edwardii]WBP83808.1 GNAT family N-acetyltransferase [Mycoplasmopsis edwardii]
MKKFALAKESQKQKILDFLYKKDPIQYLFLISDIEQFGLQSEIHNTYVLNAPHSFDAIVMSFYNNLLIFKKDEVRISHDFLTNIIKEKSIKNVIYASNYYNEFKYFAKKNDLNIKVHKEFILSLNQKDFYSNNYLDNLKSTKIIQEDLQGIIDSRSKIKEFENLSAQALDINFLKDSFEKGYYKGFIIKDNNQVVSHASTSAKVDGVAMVGGVFTLDSHRQKGYAYDCVVNLCDNLLCDKITPVLFFDNPNAGKMYYKIGFKDYSKIYVTEIID